MSTTEVMIYELPFKCIKLEDINFLDRAAIYVIICVDLNGSWDVIYVGQTGKLGTTIDTHERKACWEEACPDNTIWVCIYPTPSSAYTKQERIELEGEIREFYKPVCGER